MRLAVAIFRMKVIGLQASFLNGDGINIDDGRDVSFPASYGSSVLPTIKDLGTKQGAYVNK